MSDESLIKTNYKALKKVSKGRETGKEKIFISVFLDLSPKRKGSFLPPLPHSMVCRLCVNNWLNGQLEKPCSIIINHRLISASIWIKPSISVNLISTDPRQTRPLPINTPQQTFQQTPNKHSHFQNRKMKSEDPVPKSGISKLWRKLSPGKKSNSALSSSTASTAGSDTPTSPLQAVFDFFDEDRNGKISVEEICTCVRMAGGHLTAEEAEAAVRSWDADGDGELEFGEFQGMMEGKGAEAEEEKQKALREAFGMYASEGKGCITAASLRRMLRRLGESKSIDDCKQMIRSFDLDGDGVLSFAEFAVMMR